MGRGRVGRPCEVALKMSRGGRAFAVTHVRPCPCDRYLSRLLSFFQSLTKHPLRSPQFHIARLWATRLRKYSYGVSYRHGVSRATSSPSGHCLAGACHCARARAELRSRCCGSHRFLRNLVKDPLRRPRRVAGGARRLSRCCKEASIRTIRDGMAAPQGGWTSLACNLRSARPGL